MARRYGYREKRDGGGKTTRNSQTCVWKCKLGDLDLKIIPKEKGIYNHNNKLQSNSTNIQVKNTNEQ